MIPDLLPYLLEDFWNLQKSTKYGHSDLLFITRILWNLPENYGSVFETYYFCTSKNLELWKIWQLVYILLEINVPFVFLGGSSATSLFIDFGKGGRRKMMKIPVKISSKSWRWDQYLSKTWNWNLVTLLSGTGIPSTPQHTDSHPCTRPRYQPMNPSERKWVSLHGRAPWWRSRLRSQILLVSVLPLTSRRIIFPEEKQDLT